MKSAKSYFSKPLFRDLLKRHWWFGFINLVALFFAIPINYLVNAQRFTRIPMENAMLELQKYTASFFALTTQGAGVSTTIAIGSAIAAALIFFNYLHKKDQINFFHSQPISRQTLFFIRVLAALTLFIVPFIFNMGIALIIAIIKGLISQVAWGALIGQMGFVLMVFAAIFAIAVLAGMLCGIVFTQVEMILLLLFAPVLVYTSVVMVCQRFYDTFYSDYFFNKAIYYSPAIHFTSMVSGQANINAVICLIYIAGTIGLLAAALGLYLKRPSEGAGQPLVFNISKPVVKYISCFIVAVLLGMFFDQLGGQSFMIFGFVAGALLCSLFAEAQFNRDFKAMFRGMKGMAVFGVIFALFVSAVAYDVTGYDKYLPAKDKVSAVRLSWDDTDLRFNSHIAQRNYQNQNQGLTRFASPQVVDNFMTIADDVLKNDNYAKRQQANNRLQTNMVMQMTTVNKHNITVIYEMESGRLVARRYNTVDFLPIKDSVQSILSSSEYKSKHAIMQIKPTDLPKNISVEPTDRVNADYLYSKSTNNPKQIADLVSAIKADVQETGSSVDNAVVYSVNMDSPSYSERINIYQNYRHTLELLDKIATPTDKAPISDMKNINRIDVYQLGGKAAAPVSIESPQEIAQVLKGSRAYFGSDAMTLADEYMISIPVTPNSGMSPGEYEKMAQVKAEEAKENRFFVLGKTPELVKKYFQ